VLVLEVAKVVVVKRVDVAMAIAKTANIETVAFVFIVSPY
jgi:hypothetical protein